jgi:SET domain-containing protein
LNHSLSPNIEARHRFVNGEKRIAFYAKQDILAQAEVRD